MLDLRCYFITGAGTPAHIIATAQAAAAGGAGVIQIRSKPTTARALYELSRQVALAVAASNPHTKVLIDDRLDIALALRAQLVPIHGVHLGQEDLPVIAARKLLGSDAIIGLTTGTAELIEKANEQSEVIDYIGAGPFRPTPTKDSGRPPIGLAGYPELVALSQVPVVAIGDVQPSDVAELSATGISGVAMVRAFMDATHPDLVARAVLADFGITHG